MRSAAWLAAGAAALYGLHRLALLLESRGWEDESGDDPPWKLGQR